MAILAQLPKLTTIDEWEPWITAVKQYAQIHEVWDHINPSTEGPSVWPKEPAEPMDDDPAITWTRYSVRLKKYEVLHIKLYNVATMIAGSIDTWFDPFIRGVTHPRDMLQPLYNLLRQTTQQHDA